VRLYLEKDGYQVLPAYDGQQALELARHKLPDLLVLDLMLPKIDGLDLCRILRAETKVPIILLTARTSENDKLLGLDLGADDYVTKPFSRASCWRGCGPFCAALRPRLSRPSPAKYTMATLSIHFPGREVRLQGRLVRLTPKNTAAGNSWSRSPTGPLRGWNCWSVRSVLITRDWSGQWTCT